MITARTRPGDSTGYRTRTDCLKLTRQLRSVHVLLGSPGSGCLQEMTRRYSPLRLPSEGPGSRLPACLLRPLYKHHWPEVSVHPLYLPQIGQIPLGLRRSQYSECSYRQTCPRLVGIFERSELVGHRRIPTTHGLGPGQ